MYPKVTDTQVTCLKIRCPAFRMLALTLAPISSRRISALQTRILPLMLTCIIEIPVLKMMSGGSDRLCALLGRHNQQLLVGFIPLIAAVSGTLSSQASSLTSRAISYGHVSTSSAFQGWLLSECKVAAVVGAVGGVVIGALAFTCTASAEMSKNVAFALTVGILQFISSTCAGWTGTVAPVVTCSLFQKNARHMGGFLERSVQDVVATFLTTSLAYLLLLLLVAPVTESGECVA